MVTKLAFSFVSGLAWAGFYLVRFGERVLPQSVLSFLLWVPAAVWGLAESARQRKVMAAWHRFPQPWRPNRARFFLRHSLGLNHARFVYLWPDRLPRTRWLGRCRLEARWDLARLRQADRRVVLASLHFGPFDTLPYWLRAHGIVVTVLVGRPAPRQRLKRRQYALSAPFDVPLVLPVTEMSRVRQVLGQARHLLVMMDVDRGKQVDVPFDGYLFRMATGAIRLAAMADADLIICLIVETTTWQFVIHFGTPVPRRYLGRSPDLKGAATHLLQEFLQVVSNHPAQSGHRLLSCITRVGAGNRPTARSG